MANNKEENQFHEPEENNTGATAATVIIEEDKDMLVDDNVINRAHAAAGTSGATTQEWTPPPYTPSADDEAEIIEPGKGNTNHQFVNEELVDLPYSEKEEAAANMADMSIAAYGELKRELGNWLIPIKKRRLNKLEEKGIINLDIQLPMRGGGYAPAQQFIDGYNAKAYDMFGIRPGFAEKVRPKLIKEFAKNNIGLTNLQSIGVDILFDFKEEIKIAQDLKETGNEIIEALKEATIAFNNPGNQAFNFSASSSPNPVANQPVAEAVVAEPIPSPPPFVQQPQSFETNNPANAFDAIQNSRGSGSPIPPSAVPPPPLRPGATVSNLRPARKKSGKRGPYKKKLRKE